MMRHRISSIAIVSCCCLTGICWAQQDLNLNFEKKSVEVGRPWGWTVESNVQGTTVGLDSSVRHDGAYSLHVQSGVADEASTLVVAYVEPYGLRQKHINISAWTKATDLEGEAFVSLEWADSAGVSRIEVGNKISKSTDWSLAKVTADIPKEAVSFRIILNQKGIGHAWFDGLKVTVNDRMVETVDVAKPFTKQQQAKLRTLSSKVQTVDGAKPGETGSFDDLKTFGAIAGQATLIAMGESTHGTSEFFRLKLLALQYAVAKLGVRVFAIEDNMLIAERVNNYVLYGIGKESSRSSAARNSMYGMFSVWQNQEVFDLIKWVRSYNVAHPKDMVEFVGFDMQRVNEPLDSLFAFVSRHDPKFMSTIDPLLAGIKKDGANSYMISDSIKKGWSVQAAELWTHILQHKPQWLQNAKTKKDSVSVEWGVQYANLVRQFAENAYRGHMSLYRDVAMAENVSWLLAMRKPGTKILMWAHDNHISRGDNTNAAVNYYNGISMGSHLSKKFGQQYKAFGLFTYSGAYLAQISYSNFEQIDCPLYPGPVGSLDEALHGIARDMKSQALLLDLRNTRALDWLSRPIPVRFANHVSMEYSYWTQFSIPYQFDGIFFVDWTTPARRAGDR